MQHKTTSSRTTPSSPSLSLRYYGKFEYVFVFATSSSTCTSSTFTLSSMYSTKWGCGFWAKRKIQYRSTTDIYIHIWSDDRLVMADGSSVHWNHKNTMRKLSLVLLPAVRSSFQYLPRLIHRQRSLCARKLYWKRSMAESVRLFKSDAINEAMLKLFIRFAPSDFFCFFLASENGC